MPKRAPEPDLSTLTYGPMTMELKAAYDYLDEHEASLAGSPNVSDARMEAIARHKSAVRSVANWLRNWKDAGLE